MKTTEHTPNLHSAPRPAGGAKEIKAAGFDLWLCASSEQKPDEAEGLSVVHAIVRDEASRPPTDKEIGIFYACVDFVARAIGEGRKVLCTDENRGSFLAGLISRKLGVSPVQAVEVARAAGLKNPMLAAWLALPELPTVASAPARAPSGKPIPYIATPMYGGMATQSYVMSLIGLMAGLAVNGVPIRYGFQDRESLIPRARNRAVGHFLTSDATHLVFIDADIGFNAQHVIDMMESGLPVVCGAYPAKGIEWGQIMEGIKDGKVFLAEEAAQAGARFVINFEKDHIDRDTYEFTELPDGRRFVSVREASTGFLCIERNVIEQMVNAYPERAYNSDQTDSTGERGMLHYDLFGCGRDPLDDPFNELRALMRGPRNDDIAWAEACERLRRAALVQSHDKDFTHGRYLSEDYYFCRLWKMLGGKIWVYTGAHLTHTGTYIYEGRFESFFDGESKRKPVSEKREAA